MLRYGMALVIIWTIGVAVSDVQAQGFSGFCEDCRRDYRRNRSWPEPFLKPDRQAVLTPFAIQVANGWRRQNLISDYHFNEENGQLTPAGEMKVRYILTQMPPNRRTIYVQRGLAPETTESRMTVVQHAASNMTAPGFMADIVQSDLIDEGWPAEDIDAVSRKFQSTRPDPRLKAASSGDSSGGGGGGGGSP